MLSKEIRTEPLLLEISAAAEKARTINNDILDNFFNDNYNYEEIKSVVICKFNEYKTKAQISQDYILEIKKKITELEKVAEVNE